MSKLQIQPFARNIWLKAESGTSTDVVQMLPSSFVMDIELSDDEAWDIYIVKDGESTLLLSIALGGTTDIIKI